jgi:exopolysaccharide/PEP-CTERM locus tyrosine autokinase
MSSIERAMKQAQTRGRQAARPADEQPEAAGPREAPPPETAEHKAAEAFDRGGHVDLDFGLLGSRGYLTPGGGDPRLQEEYRMVKRPLLAHAFGAAQDGVNPGNLIQVTSSQLGEGKTFTVFNLGMSIAMELDYTVLLIDGDLTRRSLTRLLGLTHRKGLTDALEADGEGLSDMIVNTNVPALRVLPSGEINPRSTELMASRHMKNLTEEVAARYPDRVVLFDSPPLLMDSQAATLAGQMGQVLMVVEAGHTPERMVRESLNLLDPASARISFLLNKGPSGYGAGYYYGKY